MRTGTRIIRSASARTSESAARSPAPATGATTTRVGEWLLALAIAVGALGLNLANRDFPWRYHADEGKKVRFIVSAEQDWKHPILLLHLGRAAAATAGAKSRQEVVEAGRTVSGVLGALAVLLAWRLFRRALEPAYALAGSAIVAASPLLVVHAHYLKEDVLLLAASLASLLALVRFLERRDRASLLALGIALGVAFSSHYKAVLLTVVALLLPLAIRIERRRAFLVELAGAHAVAAGIFLAVNHPLLSEWSAFRAGLGYEARHVIRGHDVWISPFAYGLGFHLRESLLPGVTPPVLALAAVGIVLAAARGRAPSLTVRALLLFGAVSYFAVELSPLKPFPGYVRYALPVVPAIGLAAGIALAGLARVRGGRLRWLVPLVAIVAVAAPALRSLRLVEGLVNDTRVRSDRWVERHATLAVFESSASGLHRHVHSLAEVDVEALRRSGVTHLVASSFIYERYALGMRLGGRPASVASAAEFYRRLFARPHVELRPEIESFAFSNPTIRIVDVAAPDRPPSAEWSALDDDDPREHQRARMVTQQAASSMP